MSKKIFFSETLSQADVVDITVYDKVENLKEIWENNLDDGNYDFLNGFDLPSTPFSFKPGLASLSYLERRNFDFTAWRDGVKASMLLASFDYDFPYASNFLYEKFTVSELLDIKGSFWRILIQKLISKDLYNEVLIEWILPKVDFPNRCILYLFPLTETQKDFLDRTFTVYTIKHYSKRTKFIYFLSPKYREILQTLFPETIFEPMTREEFYISIYSSSTAYSPFEEILKRNEGFII